MSEYLRLIAFMLVCALLLSCAALFVSGADRAGTSPVREGMLPLHTVRLQALRSEPDAERIRSSSPRISGFKTDGQTSGEQEAKTDRPVSAYSIRGKDILARFCRRSAAPESDDGRGIAAAKENVILKLL